MFSRARTDSILPGWSVAAAATVALFAGVLIAALGAKIALDQHFAWPCPVRSIFHVPCPSCGTTRALSALSRGDLLAAFRFNPLAMLAIPIGTILLWFRERKWAGIGWPVFFAAVALNWVYLLFFLPP